MKKILLVLLLVQALAIRTAAQDIKITKFERNVTSLIGSMDPIIDNAGEACAVIRFFVRDEGFEIEPNLGVLKTDRKTGEIRMWVPTGTKRLTIRHAGAMPLSGYELPISLEPKVTYDAALEMTEARKAASGLDMRFFVGAGYNVGTLLGPALTIGLNISHHIVELDAIIGTSKTDDLYFYNSSGDAIAAYNYKPIRLSARYGYEIKASDMFSMIPQIGGAFNSMTGTAVGTMTQNGTYKSASSVSGLIAVKATFNLSKNFALHLTPEYDFGLSKDNVCKLMSDNDDTFKGWTDGFNLNVGLMIYF